MSTKCPLKRCSIILAILLAWVVPALGGCDTEAVYGGFFPGYHLRITSIDPDAVQALEFTCFIQRDAHGHEVDMSWVVTLDGDVLAADRLFAELHALCDFPERFTLVVVSICADGQRREARCVVRLTPAARIQNPAYVHLDR